MLHLRRCVVLRVLVPLRQPCPELERVEHAVQIAWPVVEVLKERFPHCPRPTYRLVFVFPALIGGHDGVKQFVRHATRASSGGLRR